MERLGKSTTNPGNPPRQWQIMTNEPHAYAMNAKTSGENIHETWCLQEKLVVAIDPNVLLHFLALPFPYFSKTPSMPHSPRVLQEHSKCPRVWERERIMRESSNTKLTKGYQLILISIFMDEASIFFIFHYFPSFSSSYVACDLSPHFSPNFNYFRK